MKSGKGILYSLIAIVVLGSCSPAAKLRRANKLIAQAEATGEVNWRSDTIRIVQEIPVPEVKTDTIVKLTMDTVFLTKDRLTVKVRVDTVRKKVFVSGDCKADTIRVEVPVRITREIHAPPPRVSTWDWIIIALLAFFAGHLRPLRLFLKLRS